MLRADEKTPIQALDRWQPLLLIRPRQSERAHMTTWTLFAALEVKSGRMLGDLQERHRSCALRSHQCFLVEAGGHYFRS